MPVLICNDYSGCSGDTIGKSRTTGLIASALPRSDVDKNSEEACPRLRQGFPLVESFILRIGIVAVSNRNVITWTVFCCAAVALVGVQLSSPSGSVKTPTVVADRPASDAVHSSRGREWSRARTVGNGSGKIGSNDAVIRPAVMSEPLDAKPIRTADGQTESSASHTGKSTDRPISRFAQVKAEMKSATQRIGQGKGSDMAQSELEFGTQSPSQQTVAAGLSHETREGRVANASGASPESESVSADFTEAATTRARAGLSSRSGEIELVGGLGDERVGDERGLGGQQQEALRAREVPVEAPWQLPSDVEIKVAHHLEYGKSLARRGALYSAELEFLRGLRLISQSIDRIAGETEHTSRLDWALQAIREADDLVRLTSNATSGTDLRELTSGHATRIFTDRQLSRMTPAEVVDGYREFAERNLVFAGGRTIVAGEAAFCLGKLNTLRDRAQADASHTDRDHAILFHRVALLSDPRHARAANELGVLYAEVGRLDEAKTALIQSLRIHQRPETWANLATVHERLGEGRLAQLAAIELQKSLRGETPARSGDRIIQWLPPEQFARQTPRPMVEMERQSGPIGVSDERPGRSAEKPSSVLERTAFESERVSR